MDFSLSSLETEQDTSQRGLGIAPVHEIVLECVYGEHTERNS
jgi:hypothetical protein